MTHTKRTPQFEEEVAAHANFLATLAVNDPRLNRIAEILLTNTTDSPCIVKASRNEPIFVLCGNDNTAADLVAKWAERFRTWIANRLLPEAQEVVLMAKWRDAIKCAQEMREWSTQKSPD